MDEDESLRRFGLHPAGDDLGEVRDMLAACAARERQRQGDGDTELMKLCCVHLFNAGSLAASAALDYLRRCEAAGDFAGFSPGKQSRWYSAYYAG